MTPGGFSHPDHIVKNLHVPEGAHVADFGSGSGYFAILFAQMIGVDGTVTAIDVRKSALEVVDTKAKDAGLSNVHIVRSNLENEKGSGLDDASQDMVLLANILFQSQKKDPIMKEARRVLKKDGQLVMIDWNPSVPFGSTEEGWKLSRDDAHSLAKQHEFLFVKEFPASINHWGLLFKK